RHLARGLAEGHPHAHRTQAVERGRERILADRIIDDMAKLAAGDPAHLRDEIGFAIIDHMVVAILFRERHLLRRSGGADRGRPDMAQPLPRYEADLPGSGMKK